MPSVAHKEYRYSTTLYLIWRYISMLGFILHNKIYLEKMLNTLTVSKFEILGFLPFLKWKKSQKCQFWKLYIMSLSNLEIVNLHSAINRLIVGYQADVTVMF